jgi:hypothetical protein
MENTIIWATIFAILIPLFTQLLKKYSEVINNNQALTRVLVVVVALFGALAAQLTAHGWPVNWEIVVAAASGTVMGAEWTYAWILKTISGSTKLRGAAAEAEVK